MNYFNSLMSVARSLELVNGGITKLEVRVYADSYVEVLMDDQPIKSYKAQSKIPV